MLNIVSDPPKDKNDLLSFGFVEFARLGAKRILTRPLLLGVKNTVLNLSR